MPLSLSICSQSGPPICTSFWAFFRALKALKSLQIKFSHKLIGRIEIYKTEIFMSLPLSVLSQCGPPKSVGGVIYHTSKFNWSIYVGVATFFVRTRVKKLKLDEKSIENGLEGQKCSVGGLFWGWLPPP